MKIKQLINTKKIFVILAVIVAILAIAMAISSRFSSKEKRNDFNRLSTESYNAAFLSMYPTDYFNEADFAHWRGMTLVKTDYEIPNLTTLASYLSAIGKSGNIINTIYLGVLPEKLAADELAALLQSYPSVHFEIILPNPSLDYWLELSEEECATQLDCYRNFILPLLQYDNMSLYYFGASEWLVANPGNYSGDFTTTETASLTIMLNSDRDHAYLLTVEKAEAALEELHSLIAENRAVTPNYPDMTAETIIFLGDSVIANFDGSTSIPGAVAGLTNAQVFNLGLGGGSAAENSDVDNCSLPNITEAIINRDISTLPLNPEAAQDASLYENLSSYLKTETPKDLCFVINYGLNDYFSGLPIASEDSNDIYTFTGAIRISVQALQAAFPDAKILLITPNFTTYYGNGTEYRYDVTHTLQDYADALIALSEELDVLLLDNYNELGIDSNNHPTYLSDGCHPNELGRFLMAQRIAVKLGKAN